MTNRLPWFRLLFITLVLAGGGVFAQSFKSEAELRKQAEKDFKKEDYAAALPLYSQLLSLNQKDALLNYRYGICLLMADKDKTSSLNFLEFAARDAKTDEDVYYYIGKSLQLKYRFDEAISSYKDFIKWVGGSTAKKFDTERQIETCKNAKELMKSRVNVTVKSSKEVSKNAIYGSYDIPTPAGKFLATSERFMTNIDKRKILIPIMFLTADGQTIYYTSYGRTEDNGKDIYVVHKLPTGEWAAPQSLGATVNTKYDEEYPYLDADGKTLYFSSKGHNSMGGYDIFKSTLDANTGEWSEPVNLGAGINSPDDDFFYMPAADGEAQYASSKETAKGMVMIYTIETAASQKALATIHGKYKSMDQTRADGKISVLRKSDKGLVSSARTDQKTGEYELSLPGGDDYEIVVEGGGYMPHVEDFSLPPIDHAVAINQEVSMNRTKGGEELEIRNQYLQGDSTATIAAAVLKEPQVIRDQYKADEMSKDKLEQVTINGQVVYATPPSAKSEANGSAAVATPTMSPGDSVSLNNGAAGKEQKQVSTTETQTAANTAAPGKTTEESPATQKASKPMTEKEKRIAAEKKKKMDDVRASLRMGDDERPATGNESVKIALSDAADLDDEAKEIAGDAAVAHATAIKQDSVSNVQLSKSVEALKAGDEGSAREYTRLSQLNADSAQQEHILATELDKHAKTKQAEADKALADAKELQKSSAKNASGKVAVNEPKNNKKDGQQKESNDEKKNADKTTAGNVTAQQAKDSAGAVAEDSTQAASPKDAGALQAVNEVKSPEAQTEKETVAHNATGEVEADNNSKSNQPVNVNASSDKNATMPESAKGNAGTTTKDKELAGGVGTSGGVSHAENNSNAVADMPSTSEEATKRADELKAQAKDFKLQSEGLKEQVKKSDDKELNKEWTKQATTYADSAKLMSKEADKEMVVAKALKKKEEKNAPKIKEVAKAATTKKKEAEQPIATNTAEERKQNESEKTPVAVNNPVSAEEPVAKTNDHDAAKSQKPDATASAEASATSKQPVSNNTALGVTEKPGDNSGTVETTKENTPANQTTSNTSVAKTGTANQTETAATANADANANEDAKTAQLVKNVAPEAVTSYKEYLKTKRESDSEARQSDELQARVEKMPPSPERDQLIQKANDLNIQSIKTWQQAQVKLNNAMQIDPAVDTKLQGAHFAGINSVETDNAVAGSSATAASGNKEAGNKTATPNNDINKDHLLSEAELQKEKQKDSLISQAVNHRVNAEDAKDTATEKSELQETKQLIVESATPGNTGSTNKSVTKKKAGKQKDNAATGLNTNEESKNIAEQPAAQANEKSSSEPKNKTSVVTTAEAASKTTGDIGSVRKEAATKSTAKEAGSTGEVAESGSSGNMASAVLDAKTLHVDESAVFSVSPKQVYSAANPVPMIPQLPEGLVFKVQIGAFHTPLSPEAFKNVQPLSGETTRAGWIRYCVGLFRTFDPANLVKMEMRSGGYKDAFVVAYFNGKRISLFEAYSIINRSGSNEKKLYADASEKESNHLSNLNIKASSHPVNNDPDAASFFGTSASTTKVDESAVEYAVQVGVFKSSAVPKKLQTLIPLNAESYKNNLYRFTTGRFSVRSAADSMRLVAVSTGVKDAFVIIYKGGKRAGESYSSVAGSKSPAAAGTTVTPATGTNVSAASSTSGSDIVFKVQVGAYRADLTEAKLSTLKAQCNAELSQSLSASGLHLVYAGSFKDYNLALVLKNELVAKGVKDAFVTAFSGDTKIQVQKALLQGGK